MHSVWLDATRIIKHHNVHCWTSVDKPEVVVDSECEKQWEIVIKSRLAEYKLTPSHQSFVGTGTSLLEFFTTIISYWKLGGRSFVERRINPDCRKVLCTF